MQKRASKTPKTKNPLLLLMILATYIKLANEKKNIELLKATIPKSTLNPVDGHSPRRVLEDSMKKK